MMNKRILFGVLALAFLLGSILRWVTTGGFAWLLMLFFAALCAWFSIRSSDKPGR
ncbi:hypothetical protein [Pantoea osteomyelitidis]|uniref:hypothetical protein n=1 Tax=Pantoea osteomyelitidis TaxID=3230026 RepID=UPI0037CA2F4B